MVRETKSQSPGLEMGKHSPSVIANKLYLVDNLTLMCLYERKAFYTWDKMLRGMLGSYSSTVTGREDHYIP